MKRPAVVVGLALVLLASGCSDDGGASPTLPPITAMPTVSATSSATPSTGATPSASVSLRAFPDTPQGASAFARFLAEQIEIAYDEKNPDRLRPLFDANCDACSRYLSTLSRLQSGVVTVVRDRPTTISAESPGDPGPRHVYLRQKRDRVVFKDRSGKVTGEEPAGEYTFRMTLRRTGSSYVLAEQTVSLG